MSIASAPRRAEDIPIEELKAKLSDPAWRIANLYTVVTDEGRRMPFRPNPEQMQLFQRMHWSNLILKARQLGFTTFIDILALDQALFNRNFTAAIIAHTLQDVGKIFRNKVRGVYEHLPRFVRELHPLRSESTTELVWANGSSIGVGTSARGGTLQLLHVSEMGKIARKDPKKATEIVTGAFEAVPTGRGIKLIESTAEGRAGWFYDACMGALRHQQQGSKLTALDFRLHFYPWFQKQAYAIDPQGVHIPAEVLRYFDELEAKLGRAFSDAQVAWYAKKLATLGGEMKREYPSFPEEAFAVAVDGMIYASEMRSVRLAGRIGYCPLRPGIAVNTFWDFGVNDHNSIWLHQRVGGMNRFVAFTQDQNQGLRHYWEWLEKWRQANGARWGVHYLPHDADTRMQGEEVETKRQILEQLGMRNAKVVPRTPSLTTAIDAVRRVLPTECEFDEAGCEEGIDALDNYSREWDQHAGNWSRNPRHDVYSHGADAFRQFAQGYQPADELLPEVRAVQPVSNWGRGGY